MARACDEASQLHEAHRLLPYGHTSINNNSIICGLLLSEVRNQIDKEALYEAALSKKPLQHFAPFGITRLKIPKDNGTVEIGVTILTDRSGTAELIHQIYHLQIERTEFGQLKTKFLGKE